MIEQESVPPKGILWARKSGLAVLDQALFAGANFLLNILLARWLTPAEYGAFALAYSVLLFLILFHTATLIEPMMVFGAGKYAEHFEKYLGILLRGHFGLLVPGSLLLLGAAFLLGRFYSASVQSGFVALALAAPLILLLWLARRAYYVRLQPGWAALGGGIYLLLLVASIYALRVTDRLSPATAFVGMGLGSLVAGGFLLARLRPQWTRASGNPTPALVAKDHWQYARWSMATAVVAWFPNNIYYALLPIWLGLEAGGALRALMNLANPALHTLMALSMLLLPLLVRHRQEGEPRAMSRTMKFSLALFLAGSAVYLGLLWGFRSVIFQFLYAGKYQEYASWPLLLAGLLPLGASVTWVLAAGLRALARPDWIFCCYLPASLVALTIGIPLAATQGIPGALGGLLAYYTLPGLAMVWFYQRWRRQQAGGNA